MRVGRVRARLCYKGPTSSETFNNLGIAFEESSENCQCYEDDH